MMTLFAVQTSEGWVVVLQDSMSSTYEDEGPIPWFRTEMAIFYIVYFVVFPFFFVNIFVALVIVTFNELGEAELTEDIDKNQVNTNPAKQLTNPMLMTHFQIRLIQYCSHWLYMFTYLKSMIK